MPSRSSSKRSKTAPESAAIEHTEGGAVLTEVVLAVFRLNGDFLHAAEEIAGPTGLTAARWQVLAAVLDEPRTVPEIARRMGLSRQGVQRISDILADEGFATYLDNPAHRRAKLLSISDDGRAAIRRLAGRQRTWANAVSEGVPTPSLRACLRTLRRLTERVEAQR